MGKIFISYSSPDRELAQHIAKLLEDAGHLVWWDAELLGGDEFRAEIANKLRESTHVIVIWTANSVRSTWVQDEAEEAKEAGRLIPVLHPDIKRSDVPLGFRHLHFIPLHEADMIVKSIRSEGDAMSIGSLTAKPKIGYFWKVVKNPILYVALTTALLAYVIFPGFLAGILLGLLVALLFVAWIANS